MVWSKERVYFLRAYFLWWVGMAFLGSLFINGPSKTFLGAAYNPAVWNVAGLIALILATLQTRYRSEIKRFFECPLVVRLGTLAFLGMQCLFAWEHYEKKPDGMAAFVLSVFGFFTFCKLLHFTAAAYRAVRKLKPAGLPTSP